MYSVFSAASISKCWLNCVKLGMLNGRYFETGVSELKKLKFNSLFSHYKNINFTARCASFVNAKKTLEVIGGVHKC